MNNCLNCGNEVNNKYCDVSCQNKHKKLLCIEQYDLNPKHCLGCGEKLEYDKRKNNFCTSSCSTTKNNIGQQRNLKISKLSDDVIKDKFYSSNGVKEFYKSIGYSEKPTSKSLDIIKNKLIELSLDFSFLNKRNVSNKTKLELFNKRLNWQSARSAIAKDSRFVYNNSDKPKCCYVCGYDKHIEIAHIKSVSSFDDETKVSDINNIDNLVALCPNHHWEFDNGLLNILR